MPHAGSMFFGESTTCSGFFYRRKPIEANMDEAKKSLRPNDSTKAPKKISSSAKEPDSSREIAVLASNSHYEISPESSKPVVQNYHVSIMQNVLKFTVNSLSTEEQQFIYSLGDFDVPLEGKIVVSIGRKLRRKKVIDTLTYLSQTVRNFAKNLDDSKLQKCGIFGGVGFSKDGVKTIFINWDKWISEVSDADLVQQIMYKMVFTMINDVETARKGIAIVHDLRTWTMKKRASTAVQRRKAEMAPYLPVRLKGLYLVEAPFVMRGVISVAKSLIMPKWLGKRMHKCKLDGLGEFYEADQIPKFMGGTNESTFIFDNDVLKRLFINQDYPSDIPLN